MNRRRFLKSGVLWVPPLFAIGRARGQVLTLADSAMVGRSRPSASADYTAYATNFGSGDYLSKTGGIGASNSKLGLVSFWIKLAGGNGATQNILHNPGTEFRVWRLTTNALRIAAYDSTPSAIAIQMTSTATLTADGNWHHVFIAWDTSDAGKCSIVIDGTAGVTINTRVDIAVILTTSSWQVSSATSNLDGDLCEVWFGGGQWLDPTSSASIEKFRSTGAKPVSLGSDGSTPTGSQPNIYLKNAYSSFETNSGTGGNFTVTGTLASATAP